MLNAICHSRPVFTNQASHTPMAHAEHFRVVLRPVEVAQD